MVTENLSTAPSKPKRQMLNVDLGDLRSPFWAACEAAGVSPSESIRTLVSASLGGGAPPLVAQAKADYQVRSKQSVVPASSIAGLHETRTEKLTVRLGPTQRRAVEALAAKEGFAVSRWLAALIRARLGAGPQFGRGDLSVLAESSQQLAAIGRNLNQIARKLNSQEHISTAYDREVVDGLRVALREHRAVLSQVILANMERWHGVSGSDRKGRGDDSVSA